MEFHFAISPVGFLVFFDVFSVRLGGEKATHMTPVWAPRWSPTRTKIDATIVGKNNSFGKSIFVVFNGCGDPTWVQYGNKLVPKMHQIRTDPKYTKNTLAAA